MDGVQCDLDTTAYRGATGIAAGARVVSLSCEPTRTRQKVQSQPHREYESRIRILIVKISIFLVLLSSLLAMVFLKVRELLIVFVLHLLLLLSFRDLVHAHRASATWTTSCNVC